MIDRDRDGNNDPDGWMDLCDDEVRAYESETDPDGGTILTPEYR